MIPADSLAEDLKTEALREGFAEAGVVDLETALASFEFQAHLARYDAWLADGSAAAMPYLARGRDRRADPRLVFPEARSVLCVLAPYAKNPPGASAPERGPRFARYIGGADYHEEVASRLERSLEQVRTRHPGLRWKTCVDTSAVLERSWAALAGLGWIGKNTLLIHPRHGSFTFIGVALLNQTTGKGVSLHPDFCGNCRRCLEGCPTRAFPRERWLDPRLCISSWTLETRGRLPLSAERKRAVSSRVAGCDVCQEVCPFNRKALRREGASPGGGGPTPDGPLGWRQLLEEDLERYRLRVRPTALSRIKPPEWSRNLAITLRNTLLELEPGKRSRLADSLLDLIRKRAADDSDSETSGDEWAETLEIALTSRGESRTT